MNDSSGNATPTLEPSVAPVAGNITGFLPKRRAVEVVLDGPVPAWVAIGARATLGTGSGCANAAAARIREATSFAILGALASGAQNVNPPVPGHWLQQFWDIGRADALRLAKAAAPSPRVIAALSQPVRVEDGVTAADVLAHVRDNLPTKVETHDLGDYGPEELAAFDAGYNQALNRAHNLLNRKPGALKMAQSASATPQAGIGRGELVPLPDYRALYQAYVALLESGRDRIRDLGGTCDPVDVMERGDIALRRARDVIAAAMTQQPAAKAAAPARSYAADASGDGTIVGPDGHRLSVDEIVAGLNAAPAPGVGEAVARLDARDLFDPARLPDRDAEGYLSHPDLARVLFVEDETDVTPFFHAAGLEFLATHYEWPDRGDEDDGISLDWLMPDVPAGDGWRLVHIGDTEDGSAVVWWCRYVGQRAALEGHTAPPAPQVDARDAERYRWLREHQTAPFQAAGGWSVYYVEVASNEPSRHRTAEEAIDAAIAAQAGEKSS